MYRSLIDLTKYVLALIIIVLVSGSITTKLTEISNIPAISDNPTNAELAQMLAYSRQAEAAYVSLGYALLGYLALLYVIFVMADLATMKVSGYQLNRKRVSTVLLGTLIVGISAILSVYNPWFLVLFSVRIQCTTQHCITGVPGTFETIRFLVRVRSLRCSRCYQSFWYGTVRTAYCSG